MPTKTMLSSVAVLLPDGGRQHMLGLFRVVVGLLFVSHGAAALFGVLGGSHGGPPPQFGAWPAWWAAVIQLVAGALVMVGLATRGAALLCSGSMAYAYFTVHQPHAAFPIQNGGEKAAMFCWCFLLITAFGPGRWALASLFRRSRVPAGGRVLAGDAGGAG